MDEKKAKKIWIGLNSKEKKRRLIKAFELLRKKAEEQLENVKEMEKDSKTPKDIRHLFVFTVVRDFWEDLDFLFSFSKKSRWKNKAHYPLRSALEKVARLAYFTRQTKEKQEQLARFEAFQIHKALYDIAGRTQDDAFQNEIQNSYLSIKGTDDPSLEDSRKEFKSGEFPDVKACIEGGGIPEPEALYTQYRDLSQLDHGNYFRIIMRKEDPNYFTRSAQLALYLANEILQGTDFHLTGKVQKDTIGLNDQCGRILAEGKVGKTQ